MPIVSTEADTGRAWGLWKIEEDEAALAHLEPIPSSTTHPRKRLEFLCGRALIKTLLERLGQPFTGLTKDLHGKPFFRDSSWQLSLSHSYPFVAAVIDKGKAVGIDLEQPKAKLLSVAPRVLNISERKDAGADMIKHCVYWCAKEALIKLHGKKDVTFRENILIEPFSLASEGLFTGRILATHIEKEAPIRYRVYDNFVLAITE